MIRVVIDRRLRHDVDHEYRRVQRAMRGEALGCRGYITGETWRDLDDPHHYIVVSTWKSRGEWEAWVNSPARQRLLKEMRNMVADERITLFEAA
jgi:heme-degrading monooxygenase HmoA